MGQIKNLRRSVCDGHMFANNFYNIWVSRKLKSNKHKFGGWKHVEGVVKQALS